MNTEYVNILQDIVDKSQSDIVLIAVIFLAALVTFFIPFYKMILKNKNIDEERRLEEKQLLIDIVEKNTNIMSTLKTTLELNNTSIITILKNINSNTNDAAIKIATMITSQDGASKKLDKIIDDHVTIEHENDEIRKKLDSNDLKLASIDEHTQYLIELVNKIKGQSK